MRTLLKKDATAHEPVDVNGSVTAIVKLVERNAAGRRIVLDLHLDPGLEPVIGNRIQIEQVVLNLLMNAFDAVQEREPALRRVRLRTLPDNLEAAIEVTDEGNGLSDDALAALFQPFHTTKRDGLGLGLWICRGIVAAHGGTLAAHRNGTGTGVTFSARQDDAFVSSRISLLFSYSNAVARDDAGFNATDTRFGHDLANQNSLSQRQAKAARRMVLKYVRQIPEGMYQMLRFGPGK